MPSAPAVDTSCQEAFAVGAGSDSVVYNPPLRSIYVGTTGNIAVVTAAGQAITLTAVPVGLLPLSCSQVKATSTTASNLVGLR